MAIALTALAFHLCGSAPGGFSVTSGLWFSQAVVLKLIGFLSGSFFFGGFLPPQNSTLQIPYRYGRMCELLVRVLRAFAIQI